MSLYGPYHDKSYVNFTDFQGIPSEDRSRFLFRNSYQVQEMEDYDSQNIYENFSSLLYFKLKNHMSLFEAIRYILLKFCVYFGCVCVCLTWQFSLHSLYHFQKIPELLKHCKAYRNDFCKIKSTKNLSEPQGLRPIWRLFSFCFLLFTF